MADTCRAERPLGEEAARSMLAGLRRSAGETQGWSLEPPCLARATSAKEEELRLPGSRLGRLNAGFNVSRLVTVCLLDVLDHKLATYSVLLLQGLVAGLVRNNSRRTWGHDAQETGRKTSKLRLTGCFARLGGCTESVAGTV